MSNGPHVTAGCFERFFDMQKAKAESTPSTSRNTAKKPIKIQERFKTLKASKETTLNKRVNRSMEDYAKFVSKFRPKKTPQEVIMDIQRDIGIVSCYKTPEAKKEARIYQRQSKADALALSQFASLNCTPRQYMSKRKMVRGNAQHLLLLHNKMMNTKLAITTQSNNSPNALKLPEFTPKDLKDSTMKSKSRQKKLTIKRYASKPISAYKCSITPKVMLAKLRNNKRHVYKLSDIPKPVPLAT
eukprot:TRINITY_DN13527_c0_g1_i1.p1 TRINITY_DN13527_c0_g1~~TRINITY_DN13527_c0_g1_i1.p1  ORF type:complete len:243 (+),score=31.30 TRINITY_DN13527_c0_g1_i1:150-878(+)